MLIRTGFGGQLSGSVGGVVASHNKGGQYLRNRSIPTNPNSGQQQRARNDFASASIGWRALTTLQRSAWESYAAQTPVLNRLGESITISGFNMYVRTNSFRLQCGATVLAAAPISPGASSLGNIASSAISAASGISFVTASANALGPVFVSMGPALSPGVLAFSGPYSGYYADTTMLATGFVDQTDSLSPLRYGVPLQGERRPIRVAGSDTDGRLSNIYEAIVTVAV
jgi:hypothetical protein